MLYKPQRIQSFFFPQRAHCAVCAIYALTSRMCPFSMHMELYFQLVVIWVPHFWCFEGVLFRRFQSLDSEWFLKSDFWFGGHQNHIPFANMKRYKQLNIQKSLCQSMYAFTAGGKRILRKIYLLFTRLEIGLYIDFKFNSVSVEQSDNLMSSEVSRVQVWNSEAMA